MGNIFGDKKVNLSVLENRDGTYFKIYGGKPYSGLAESYYENGKIKIQINFYDGKPNGMFKEYYKNGQLNKEVRYIDGNPDGIVREVYSVGQLELEGKYMILTQIKQYS